MTALQLDAILDKVLEREGGLVHHPRDPGGLTNFGISQRSYPQEDIYNMTAERAKAIYKRDYACPLRLLDIDNPTVADILLDWKINGGFNIKNIQRLVDTPVDGIWGPATVSAINQKGRSIIRPLLYLRLFHYANLTHHPFIKGWISRLIKLGL